jgi:hypothetical protein
MKRFTSAAGDVARFKAVRCFVMWIVQYFPFGFVGVCIGKLCGDPHVKERLK